MSKAIDVVNKLDPSTELTAQQLKFVNLVVQGYAYTTAYRQAFPAEADLSYATIRSKASRLATDRNIATEVQTKRQRLAHMTRLAEDRIEQILTDDDSQAKGNKVADVAMFMYEQANGKATQRTEVIGKHVVVTYDLSGGSAGPPPKEVLDQLQDQPAK